MRSRGYPWGHINHATTPAMAKFSRRGGLKKLAFSPAGPWDNPRSHKPALLNGRFGNGKVANPLPTLRQPFANLSPTLCQPFLPTPLQAPPSVGPNHPLWKCALTAVSFWRMSRIFCHVSMTFGPYVCVRAQRAIVSRQFLTRNCPRPNCLLMCLQDCLTPRREGFNSSFTINPL